MSEKLMSDEWDEAYRMGAEAMREACVAAVKALPYWVETDRRVYIAVDYEAAVAALREVRV